MTEPSAETDTTTAAPPEPREDFLRSRRSDPVKVALVYLVLMLPIALIFHQPNDGLETDFFGSYAPQARGLIENGVLPIEEYRGPVYPIVLAGARLLVGDYFLAGIVLSVLCASIVLGIIYLLIAQWWNRRLALWATVLTACNPVFVRYSYEAGTDMIFLATCFGAMYCVLQSSGLAGGIFSAVAYLTRYNGIALLLPSLFSRKRLWILVTFAILILPWGLRCWKEKGNFFYNKNYLNLAYNIYGQNRPWDNFWTDPNVHNQFTSFRSVVAFNPGLFAKRILSNVVEHLVQDVRQIVGIVQTLFAVVGLILLRPNRKQVLLFLFAASMFVFNLFAFYSERFSLILIPFYALLIVIGSERILDLVRRKVWTRRDANLPARAPWISALTNYGLIGVLALYTLTGCVRYNVPLIGSDLVVIPEIAAQIAPHMTGGTVCARKPHIIWYLNQRHSTFPTFTHVPIPNHDLVATLRRDRVDYLFLSPLEYMLRPETRPLFDLQNAPPDFFPVYYQRMPPVLVYQISHQAAPRRGP